jgi:chromosome segregation ATPase
MKAPAPAVTTANLQEQLKPVAIDLALVRRSIEQLGANQDQLARKQDQMAQAIATLQGAEQDISQKILALAPPAPKAVHVPPKPVQPPAQ